MPLGRTLLLLEVLFFFKNILHYTVNLLHLVLLRFAVELFLNYVRLNISAIRVFGKGDMMSKIFHLN